jgi:hypothetical protein
MYKEILQTIAGIEVFPVLSLVLFVTVFAGVLVRVSRMSGEQLGRLAALPFGDDSTPAAGDPTEERR